MSLDLEALRAAAQAATSGPWHQFKQDGKGNVFVYRASEKSRGIVSSSINVPVSIACTMRPEDAQFMVAAQPTAVLALIDENERLQRELKRTETSLRNLERFTGIVVPDGRELRREDYPATFTALNEDENNYTGGDFKLPDLKGNFFTAEPLGIPFSEKQPEPDCWKCHKALVNAGMNPAPRMILCPTCGNKRCPKASDHDLACTGSNEPGQPGSVY